MARDWPNTEQRGDVERGEYIHATYRKPYIILNIQMYCDILSHNFVIETHNTDFSSLKTA